MTIRHETAFGPTERALICTTPQCQASPPPAARKARARPINGFRPISWEPPLMIKPNNAAQRAARSYRLAALDQDFLLGDSTRGARYLLEYAKTEEALRACGVRSTIAVFGSAHSRARTAQACLLVPPGPDSRAHCVRAGWGAQGRRRLSR